MSLAFFALLLSALDTTCADDSVQDGMDGDEPHPCRADAPPDTLGDPALCDAQDTAQNEASAQAGSTSDDVAALSGTICWMVGAYQRGPVCIADVLTVMQPLDEVQALSAP